MEVSECFLRHADGVWIKIEECNVHMRVTRRMQRTIIRGGEGDDLDDEGAESAVYTITGTINMGKFKEVLNIFRGGQPSFHDPFEDRQMLVIFSNIDYHSTTGAFEFVLLEDAEDQKIK